MAERDDLEGRLAGWFSAEVRQAEADLRRAPLRPARARTAPIAPALRVLSPIVALLVVAVAAVGVIGRLPGPITDSPSATPGSTASVSSPTATAPRATPSQAPAAPIEGRYPDGIPMALGSHPVLR